MPRGRSESAVINKRRLEYRARARAPGITVTAEYRQGSTKEREEANRNSVYERAEVDGAAADRGAEIVAARVFHGRGRRERGGEKRADRDREFEFQGAFG